MITLSWFHDPPRGFGVGASTVTGPPIAATFFRCPSAKNPIHFPSADQNGNAAPSVPSIFFAVTSFKDCTQTESRSFCVRALKAIAVPSALITGGPEKSPVKSKLICAGGGKNDRNVRGSSRGRKYDHICAPTTSATTIASAHHQLLFWGGTSGCATLAVPAPPAAIHRNCRPTSPALCHRSSGSFAKQTCST